jgi:hypothetical protein
VQAVALVKQARQGLSPELVQAADSEYAQAAVQQEERQSLQLSLSVLKLLFAIQQAPP